MENNILLERIYELIETPLEKFYHKYEKTMETPSISKEDLKDFISLITFNEVSENRNKYFRHIEIGEYTKKEDSIRSILKIKKTAPILNEPAIKLFIKILLTIPLFLLLDTRKIKRQLDELEKTAIEGIREINKWYQEKILRIKAENQISVIAGRTKPKQKVNIKVGVKPKYETESLLHTAIRAIEGWEDMSTSQLSLALNFLSKNRLAQILKEKGWSLPNKE